MDLGLASHRALVVGANGGIGHAVCRALVANGIAGLAIGVRDLAAGNEIAQEFSATTNVRVVGCDVSDPAAPQQAISQATEALGTIDIVVMAAGNPPRGSLQDVTDAQWDAALQSKLLGSIRLTRAALPAMIDQGWGRVILTAGLNGRGPTPTSVIGGVVNAGLANFATATAKGVAADGVTVNVVDPHFTQTGRWDRMIERRMEDTGLSYEEASKAVLANVPSGRPVPPEDVANTVAFLASERAASISGMAVAVDTASKAGLY